MAQIYDFTFDSPDGSGSIEFILSGTQVTGAVAGSGTGILSGGSLSTSAANNEMHYGTMPLVLSTSNTPFFSQNSPNYVFIDTSSDQFLFASEDSADYVQEYSPGTNGSFVSGSGVFLTNESMTELTPAPIPGAGLLSYLVLGLAGLIFRGKALWWKSVTALGNYKTRSGQDFPRPTRPSPSRAGFSHKVTPRNK
jgi:hypothetical protein